MSISCAELLGAGQNKIEAISRMTDSAGALGTPALRDPAPLAKAIDFTITEMGLDTLCLMAERHAADQTIAQILIAMPEITTRPE